MHLHRAAGVLAGDGALDGVGDGLGLVLAVGQDDGTPALGTELGGKRQFEEAAVGAEGDFRFHLMAGENAVDFSLLLAPGWPASAAFTEEYRGPGSLFSCPYDSIVAPVEVKPGKTISHDIVLPRKSLRKLTLNWKGNPEENLFIGVIVDMKDYRLIRS